MTGPYAPWSPREPWWMRNTAPEAFVPRYPARRAEGVPRLADEVHLGRLEELRRGGDELHRLAEVSDTAHRLAVHEASHTVVAVALGLPLAFTTIDVDRSSGETRLAGTLPETLLDAATLFLAGQLGETARFGSATGTSDDNSVLADVLDAAPRGTLAAATDQVHEWLDRWGVHVDRLASALIRQRHLTGEQVWQIIGAFDVEPARSLAVTESRSGARPRAGDGVEVTRDFSFAPAPTVPDNDIYGPTSDPADSPSADFSDLLETFSAIIDGMDAANVAANSHQIAAVMAAITALQSSLASGD